MRAGGLAMLGLSWPDLMRLRTLQGAQVAKPGWGRAKRVLLPIEQA